MIHIDRINQVEHPYSSIYRYRFPAIDFFFQNTGMAAASLWRFAIDILQAEIDATPVLDFEADVEQGALLVSATNNGWGPAQECQIQVNEPTLVRLFTQPERQFQGQIPGGESKTILSLTKQDDNTRLFEGLRSEFTDIFHSISEPPFITTVRGIRLQTIHADWKCKDINGAAFRGEENIRSFDSMGEYIVREQGFFKTSNSRAGGGAPSDVTYSAIVDPSRGAHRRMYPMRRVIPPGAVDRFHIMVGASMSCRLHLKFAFFLDQASVVESNEFVVEIWNPRNSQWHFAYRDGAELHRDTEQHRTDFARYTNDEEREQALSWLERFQQMSSDYPFLK